ncbi:hypothetical protein AMR47_06145 [Leptospira interrogans]|nr:hypothetical protein AMR47_06145 [Leptospira interrogans]
MSIGSGFEYGVNHTHIHALSKIEYSVIQNPTDPPKDKPIKVIVSDGGKFCYGPNFSGGESYIIIEQCWQMHVMNARYDVFQRISYNINNTWLCITAPEKVIKAEKNWDYVHLRPCTINDPLQRWIIKNNSFWTANGFYRLKDYNWYGYISRNSGDRYNHTLDSSMNDWVNTIATPGNISIQTSIAWDLQTTEGQERYFIRWGGSDKNTTPLYYNPENGHLAQYDPISGSLYCMYSQVDNYQWNWVKWKWCSDLLESKSKGNPTFWNVFFETDQGGMITDYKGIALRVTRYGSNWGSAYTAKPSYLEKDTTNSPTSLFVVNKDLLDWTRYTASNLGKTGQYCPAGKRENIVHRRIKRELPPDFQLTEAWIRRLYEIATSVSAESETRVSGICGPCALHSFQMLAELLEYHSREPLQSGGYFLDTAPNTDPFISFGQRYPHLERLLEDIPKKYAPYPHYSTQSFLSFASIDSMLPQYFWSASTEFTNRDEILSHISSLINSPAGSIWLGVMEQQHPDGTITGHAAPILRISQGLVVIPTNVHLWTLEEFRRFLIPTTELSQIVANLEGSNTLIRFTTIQSLGMLTTNMFDSMVSNRNCTGEGEDRRGSGEYPTSTSVNQCPSGRCALPF